MGFVQFPGSDMEGPKSGPGTAQHLAHVYKMYLLDFDLVYLTSVLDQRNKLNANGRNNPSAQQMQIVISLADLSEQELRSRNVGDRMIQFIEQHRPQLRRTLQEQRAFRSELQPNPQMLHSDATAANAQSGPFPGSPAQASAVSNATNPSHQLFMPNKASSMQGTNFLDNRVALQQQVSAQQPVRTNAAALQPMIMAHIQKAKQEIANRRKSF